MIQGDNTEIFLPFSNDFNTSTIQTIDIACVNDKKVVVQRWAKTDCKFEERTFNDQNNAEITAICAIFTLSIDKTKLENSIGKLFLQVQITVPNSDFADGVQVFSFKFSELTELTKKY